MNALDIKVEWNFKWANDPHLQILVDKIPDFKDIVHDIKTFDNGDTAVFGEQDGYVHFFYHNPKRETGFGGSVYTVKTREIVPHEIAFGEVRDIEVLGTKSYRGPWSSRASAMNQMGFTPSLDVSLTDKRESFDKGYTFWAASVTVEFAKKALELYLPTVELVEFQYPYMKDMDEVIIVPQLKENPCDFHGADRLGDRCQNCHHKVYEMESI